ncbi:MAG TPA: polyprenyl diphosphate synthase [Thermoplasmata archaeon]|nr:polyprenyl diphosphate synthase [Thermoplasmata archaeon]
MGTRLPRRLDPSKIISDAAYQAYERRLLHQVKTAPIPNHVAIIMDGNRRFAREIGLGNALDGHTRGRDKLEEVLEWCLEVGVHILTVYAFSTENIKRPSEEIQHLMHLFAENFRKVGDDPRVHQNRIRIKVFGNREILPDDVKAAIQYAEDRTKAYDAYRFNLAVAYGGREEILQAIRDVVRDAKAGKVEPDDINEKFFSRRLYTADLPDPDLVLRTSGEERISNFLLWQLAYSELYFVDVYWPGFRKIDFLRALRSYQQRLRRYGE